MMLRHFVWSLVIVGGIAGAAVGETVPNLEPLDHPSGGNRELKQEPLRLREGSRFTDEIGEFRETGGRIAFFPDFGSSMVVLENLALERVSRDMDQGKRKWSVSGKVTEFRGSNYLILERVVLKSRNSADAIVPRS